MVEDTRSYYTEQLLLSLVSVEEERCRGRILNDRGSDQFMGYEIVGSNRRVWEKSRIIVKRETIETRW